MNAQMKTQIPTMTLDEFRATGRDVANLDADPSTTNQGWEDGSKGRVYLDNLVVCFDDLSGEHYLVIFNEQYDGTLAELEEKLYNFACDEELIAKPVAIADANFEQAEVRTAAHLQALIPELVEALQQAVRWDEATRKQMGKSESPWMPEARAVLAKVKP